ncbi:MAG TPA: hypothetical protein VGP51_01885 [Nocardioidaceae bacterium]|nr:hypothetical protein [Nocardioidaceae bacterium]
MKKLARNRTQRAVPALLLLAALGLTSCGDDDDAPVPGDDGGSTAETPNGDDETDTDDQTDDGDDTDDGTDDEADDEADDGDDTDNDGDDDNDDR